MARTRSAHRTPQPRLLKLPRVRKLRRRQDRIEHIFDRMAEFVDPNRTKDLLSWYYDDLLAEDAEEGYFIDDLAAASADDGADDRPMHADANADKCR
jgi:hypothetical protein